MKLDIKDTDVIIVPEQHLYHKPIITVPDMVKDNMTIISKLVEIILTLKNPTVIFIGDIVHQGIKNTENSFFIEDYFRTLNKLCDDRVFSVVGNHEISYSRNNPFWGVAEVTSNYVQTLMNMEYHSVIPLLKVPDNLVIGDVNYVFGHYERIYPYGEQFDNDVKQVFLLSHNSLICDEIIEMMNNGKTYGINSRFIGMTSFRDDGFIPKTNLLKKIYVGHLHKAHGVFRVVEKIGCIDYDFTIRYLASLGRTNHTEYTDDVVREIPIHHFRDGLFTGETLKEIVLPTREVAVDEIEVLKHHESYERNSEIRQLKKVQITSMDIVNDIKSVLEDKHDLLDLFERAKSNELPIELAKLLSSYKY